MRVRIQWTAAAVVALAFALMAGIVLWPDSDPSSAEHDVPVSAERGRGDSRPASPVTTGAARQSTTSTTTTSTTPAPSTSIAATAPPWTPRSSAPASSSPTSSAPPPATDAPAAEAPPTPSDAEAPTTTVATPPTAAPREPVRCVVGAPGAGGGTDLTTGFSPGYPYDEDPVRYETRPMPGYPELADLRAASTGCEQIIVHAFSEGARRAKEWYCAGESLDDRIVGYVLDDPNYFPDEGQPCTPSAGVRVALYGTQLSPSDQRWTVDYFLAHTGFGNCMDKTAARLGTPILLSPRYFHEPYTRPSPPQIANDAAHGGWFS